MQSVLDILKPKTEPLPLIFDSPHSGTDYPADFDYACTFKALEKAEDKYVDDLFAAAPNHGAHLLKALFPRSYIDTNRQIDDIDPALMEGDWPFETPINPTARSDSGIGLIRRLVSPGVPLYKRHLTPEDIKNRIETYYTPYHTALEKLLNDAHYNFGQVYHINCHSMPASSAIPKKPSLNPKPSDIVLSNRDGTTSNAEFLHICRDFFKAQGLIVTLNDPFKGVALVQNYAAPTRGRHAIQLEINKALYMNEDTCAKSENFEATKQLCTNFTTHCANYAQSQLTDLAAD